MDWEDRNPNMKGKKKRKANSYRKENGCKKRIVIKRKNKMDVNEVLGNGRKKEKQIIKERVLKKREKKGKINDGKKKKEEEITGWDFLNQVYSSRENETNENKEKRKRGGISSEAQGKIRKKKKKIGSLNREWDGERGKKEKEEDKHKKKRKLFEVKKDSGKDVEKKRPKTGAEDIRKFFRTEDKH
jgi:hypothetical protein